MLKVKCFHAESLWLLEKDVNAFLENGKEITNPNQVVSFYTSTFGSPTRPQAFFATVLYSLSQKALTEEEQKALPGEQKALPETI